LKIINVSRDEQAMPAIKIDCVTFCKALADETRQGILRLLQDQGELCVSDIVETFASSQPTISHHLRLLRNAGLVVDRKQGKQVYYSLNQDNVTECCGTLMAQFVPSFSVALLEEMTEAV
jgi:ArsR family transcriptional regulator